MNSVMLYSSTDRLTAGIQQIDANSYPPFKLVNSTVLNRITEELDALGEPEEEGISFPPVMVKR